MNWAELDWSILERLRQGFLSGAAAAGPYWQTEADLAHYDFTYAERIGWKWDHVLDELNQRQWAPAAGTLLDWGCGSGVAHRRILALWRSRFTQLAVFDHSLLAEDYALAQSRARWPDLPAQSWQRGEPIATLVISHVLNELDATAAADLEHTIASAQTVIWIEPGTSDVSRDLVTWREKLRPNFRMVYPCPHQENCGMLAPQNHRHWCHHFAAPPPAVGADSNWVKFAQRAGIDLRSLPYAALVMDRRESAPGRAHGRIIGRPKVSKPYTRFLGCDHTGVSEYSLPRKVAPTLAKKLDRPRSPRRIDWQHNEGEITRFKPAD